MAVKTFNLPDPGEGLTEAEIVSWKVAVGDTVRVNDVVVEIETSKSLVELPIPWEGTITELLVAEGTEVEVGAPIIRVEVAGADAPAPPRSDSPPPPVPAPSGPSTGGAPSSGPAGGATRTFALPDPGEGLTEAEIVSWKVAAGDAVQVNDVVVEIETSKSLVELPIPWEGTIGELLVAEGDTVEVGAPIVTVVVAGADPAAASAGPIATSPSDEAKREPNLVGYGAIAGSTTRRARKGRGAPGAPAASAAPAATPAAPVSDVPPPAPDAPPPHPAASGHSPAPAPVESVAAAAPAPVPVAGVDPSASGGVPRTGSGRPLAKPPVRKYAKDRGVDLAAVPGSGPDGIVSREDVDAFLAGGAPTPSTDAPAAVPTSASPPTAERETRIPVKGVRKMTAQAMSGSAFTAPHVTEFVTIDMTASMELVERLKADREFRDVKVSPLLLVAKALLLACRRNPGVNATWIDEADGSATVVQKNYVSLGIAAATPRGLIVPNIKDADRMTLRELADAMAALVDTARSGRTQPADMSGGSITITNVGVFGVDTGTPIINPGEAAILCFGAVRRMPWVVGAGADERIEPRWVTQLGLSFDHRLIDGDLGSRFLADIAAILHDPAKGLVWG
ncbi:2-oxo acid dehydrogenase subunit E2 [Agilicoccus flavus]|uniref:2-oxo acid dehydrogenase subunit E2 n=1 Tax=Agilicoccus flavus TaxID=2775968 RepID=UPI001CF640C4|nr:2-oxo acid dehydrogenase subunit E2 [Agilicoccus flavus]